MDAHWHISSTYPVVQRRIRVCMFWKFLFPRGCKCKVLLCLIDYVLNTTLWGRWWYLPFKGGEQKAGRDSGVASVLLYRPKQETWLLFKNNYGNTFWNNQIHFFSPIFFPRERGDNALFIPPFPQSNFILSVLILLGIIKYKKADGVIIILQMVNLRCWKTKNKWFRNILY